MGPAGGECLDQRIRIDRDAQHQATVAPVSLAEFPGYCVIAASCAANAAADEPPIRVIVSVPLPAAIIREPECK